MTLCATHDHFLFVLIAGQKLVYVNCEFQGRTRVAALSDEAAHRMADSGWFSTGVFPDWIQNVVMSGRLLGLNGDLKRFSPEITL